MQPKEGVKAITVSSITLLGWTGCSERQSGWVVEVTVPEREAASLLGWNGYSVSEILGKSLNLSGLWPSHL